ncbi:MAG: hypothetical protein KJ941_11690 [Bacteroidetes bacterium]|nr:hypothetical protein [Bacteroidota bacterium]
MKNIENISFNKDDLTGTNYNYQKNLTQKLDKLDSDFSQEIINEIVLWKVNRYAPISEKAIELLNRIKKTDSDLDKELTKNILSDLLTGHGVRLPMASSILRFKNPNIYQIIDQRVFRFINNEVLKIPLNNLEKQIEMYFTYLEKLKAVCEKYEIDFSKSDRILYDLDKKYNGDLKIKY